MERLSTDRRSFLKSALAVGAYATAAGGPDARIIDGNARIAKGLRR
jgi:hypothetical protein